MKIEPFLAWPRTAPGLPPPPAAIALPPPAAAAFAAPPADGRDPRRMSPRQLAAWAYELYVENAIDWHDYRLVGFPSELHPGFAETIGALTGEKAEPDRPRDMIAEWERRYGFDRRHHGAESPAALGCARVLALLRRQEGGWSDTRPATPAAAE